MVRVVVGIGQHGPEFSISAAAEVEANPVASGKAYSLLAEAETPVFIDEFQELAALPGRVPSLFKSFTDEYPQVSLIIAGSREHMMHELASRASGPPGCGAMQPLHLQPPVPEVMGDFVERRFNVGGKAVSRETADEIVAMAGPVPNDIQRLHVAYDVFAIANPRGKQLVSSEDVRAGNVVGRVVHAASAFADLFTALPPGQRRVLRAPCRRCRQRSLRQGAPVARSGYASASVKRAMDALQQDARSLSTEMHVTDLPRQISPVWLPRCLTIPAPVAAEPAQTSPRP